MYNFKALAEKYKEEALNTLKELIEYKSVLDEYHPDSDVPFGKENKEALDYVLNKARSFGLSAKNVYNYAGHIEYGNANGQLIGVLAHLDVVPANKDEWDSDPFTLTIKGENMYGRGVMDDKGPLVASLYAIKLLKDNQIKLTKKVRLIMGCDEESGSRCLTKYFEEEEMPVFGFSPDAEFPAIYGEKAHANYHLYLDDKENVFKSFNAGERLNIVPALAQMELNVDLKNEYLLYLKENGYEGEVKGDTYIAYGKSSHAMVPEKGLNAAFILLDFVAKNTNSSVAKYLQDYFLFDPFAKKLGLAIKDNDMGLLTMNLGTFKLENNQLVVGLDFRIPKDKYNVVIEEKFASSMKQYGFSYSQDSLTPIHYVKKDSFLVRKLMESYTAITGDNINKPFTIGGGTYAKFIEQCVAFGPQRPGSPDVCHIANEYRKINDFVEDIAIYAKAIYELGK